MSQKPPITSSYVEKKTNRTLNSWNSSPKKGNCIDEYITYKKTINFKETFLKVQKWILDDIIKWMFLFFFK